MLEIFFRDDNSRYFSFQTISNFCLKDKCAPRCTSPAHSGWCLDRLLTGHQPVYALWHQRARESMISSVGLHGCQCLALWIWNLVWKTRLEENFNKMFRGRKFFPVRDSRPFTETELKAPLKYHQVPHFPFTQTGLASYNVKLCTWPHHRLGLPARASHCGIRIVFLKS